MSGYQNGGQPWQPQGGQPAQQPWQPHGEQHQQWAPQSAQQAPQQQPWQPQGDQQHQWSPQGAQQGQGGSGQGQQFNGQQYGGPQTAGQRPDFGAQQANYGAPQPAFGAQQPNFGAPQSSPYASFSGQGGAGGFSGQQTPPPKQGSNKLWMIIIGALVLVMLAGVGIWAATRDPDPEPLPPPRPSASTPAPQPSKPNTPKPGASTPARQSPSPKPKQGSYEIDLGQGLGFDVPPGTEIVKQDASSVLLGNSERSFLILVTQTDLSKYKDANPAVAELAKGVAADLRQGKIDQGPEAMDVGANGTAALASVTGTLVNQSGSAPTFNAVVGMRRDADGQGVLIHGLAIVDDMDDMIDALDVAFAEMVDSFLG